MTGVVYNLEFKNALEAAAWSSLTNAVTGSGLVRSLNDTNAVVPNRVYRLRAVFAP